MRQPVIVRDIHEAQLLLCSHFFYLKCQISVVTLLPNNHICGAHVHNRKQQDGRKSVVFRITCAPNLGRVPLSALGQNLELWSLSQKDNPSPGHTNVLYSYFPHPTIFTTFH
jgi:hypothetical protein